MHNWDLCIKYVKIKIRLFIKRKEGGHIFTFVSQMQPPNYLLSCRSFSFGNKIVHSLCIWILQRKIANMKLVVILQIIKLWVFYMMKLKGIWLRGIKFRKRSSSIQWWWIDNCKVKGPMVNVISRSKL